MTGGWHESVGVVVIGRNEGARLERCLTALRPSFDRVVYVDSGSSDDSVVFARSMGVRVVELDPSIVFSAGRARHAGFEDLLETRPDVTHVQFIDGDCEVREEWLDAARAAFEDHEEAAVISGRRRERHPEASIYNMLADIEWDTRIGVSPACHGDAMIRVEAYRAVGGFDPSFIAGEEPEFCVRLRLAGWKIYRIDREMTLHDADMHRFGQWWKRAVRAGFAYAAGFARHGIGPTRHNLRPVVSTLAYGFALPFLVIAAAVIVSPWIILVIPACYAMLALRVARARAARGPKVALIYGCATALGKIAQAIGIARFCWTKFRGRSIGPIEYKSAAGVRA